MTQVDDTRKIPQNPPQLILTVNTGMVLPQTLAASAIQQAVIPPPHKAILGSSRTTPMAENTTENEI